MWPLLFAVSAECCMTWGTWPPPAATWSAPSPSGRPPWAPSTQTPRPLRAPSPTWKARSTNSALRLCWLVECRSSGRPQHRRAPPTSRLRPPSDATLSKLRQLDNSHNQWVGQERAQVADRGQLDAESQAVVRATPQRHPFQVGVVE